jgi:autotransporter-associated beta strand protein
MRPRTHRARLGFILAVVAAASTAGPARSQPYTWDPALTGTATGGGSGTWDTTTANWFNGTALVPWPGGQVAVFGGTVTGTSTVTIAPGGVSATGLTFNSDGYVLTGDPLTLTGVTPTITVAGVLNATVSSAIAGTAGLTKAGTGYLTLSGANTYTGTTTVGGGVLIGATTAALPGFATAGGIVVNSGGVLAVSAGGTGQWAAADITTVLGAATFNSGSGFGINVDTANTYTHAGGVGGGVSFGKFGPGTLALTGANSYTGGTVVHAGTLQVNASGALGAATGGVTLGYAVGTTAASATSANIVFNTGMTIASFNDVIPTATSTLQIAGGQTLTVGGTFAVGQTINNSTASMVLNSYTGTPAPGSGGALVVNGAMTVGLNPGAANKINATVDLQALSSFTLNAPTTTLNIGNGTNIRGILTLAGGAAGTNLINVATINIGTSGGGNAQTGSQLNLGVGTNTIQANAFNIGGGKSNATVQFQGGGGGTLTLTGTGGTGVTAITVMNETSGTATSTTGTLNLAGHNVTVNAGAVIVAQLAGSTGGTPTGTATFDTGTFNATSLAIGNDASGTSTGGVKGTFTLGTSAASTGVLTVTGTVSLVNITNTSTSAKTDFATFTINGGTANIGGDIISNRVAAAAGTATVTSTLTLAGGTLNMTGHQIGHATTTNLNITTVTLPAATQTATLMNLGGTGINDAGVTMNGAGTLILAGTNTYTGGTNATSGQLNLNSAGALGAGTLTINGGNLGNSSGSAVTLTGNSPQSWATDFMFAGPNDLNLGTGAVTLTANRLVTVAAGNLTVGGVIGDGGGGFGVTKDGPGTLTLSGANTYTGTTTVVAGTVRLGQTAPAGFVVNGTAGLSVVNPAGTSTVAVPTLTLGAGGGNSILGFELNTSTLPTAPLLTVGTSNGLTLNGGTHTINVSDPLTAPVGSFTLVSYSGTPITSGFVLGTLPTPRTAGNLDFSTPGQIKLNITGIDTLVWTGSVSADWDVGTAVNTGGTMNWKTASNNAPTNFVTGDVVAFTDTASAFAVNITTAVQPSGLTVNNSTNTYTFSGPGSITGTVGLTKQGTGTLILLTNNTYSGTTTVSAGTVQVGNGGTTGTLGTGDLADNAAVVFNRSDDVTYPGNITGTGTLTKAGAGTLTLTGAFGLTGNTTLSGGTLVLASGATYSYAGVISGTGALAKDGAGTLTLTGANTYTGPTAVRAGILSVASINSVVGGTASSALGTPTTAANGTISLGSGTTAATLQYTGAGETTDRVINLTGTTGGATIDQSGAGLLKFTGGVTATGAGAKALTLTGAGNGEIAGPVVNNSGTNPTALVKTGAGTWTLSSAANTFTGGLTILNGTVSVMADNAAGAGAVTIGDNSAATGNLNLNTFNQTVGSLTVLSNSATNDTITIGTGKTLTVTGNVAVGGNGATTATTGLVMTGGGSLVVNNPTANGSFAIGGVPTAGVLSKATADLTGLNSLTVTLNTTNGVFRVNPTNGTNVNGSFAALQLPPTTTITASALNVGDSSMQGTTNTSNQLVLGSGVTIIDVNTINVGTGGRDIGSIAFAGANGSVIVRNAAGTGRSTLNIGTGTANTGNGGPAMTFDTTGHPADLLLGAVTMATQPRSTTYTANLAFDQGTLDATSLTAATTTQTTESGNGGAAARVGNANVTLGGGTVTIQNGILNLGLLSGTSYTGNPHTVNGTVTVNGGTVTIGATAGTAVTMATLNFTGTTNTANLAANGTLVFNGGTTTLQGAVVKGGNIGGGTTTGTAAATATLTLNGGTLNVGGFAIGSAANPIDNVNLQAGTLQNVGEVNGGGAVTKTTAGILTLAGTNTYTGATNVSAGTLFVTGTTGAGAVTVGTGAANTGTLGGTGTVGGAVTVAAGGTVRGGTAATPTGSLTTAAGVTIIGATTTPGAMAVDFGGQTAPSGSPTVSRVAVTGGVFNMATTGGPFQVQLLNDGAGVLQPSTPFTITLATAPTPSNPNTGTPFQLNGTAITTNGTSPTVIDPSNYTLTSSNYTFSNVSLAVNGAGNALVLTATPVPVPEPAAVLVLAAAGLAIGGRVRRRGRVSGRRPA